MELDIREMVGKAHCYADNYLNDHLSKWYALRKAYADGYKEALKDILERVEAKSSNELNGLHKHDVSNNEVAVCDHSHGFYFDEKGIITCVRCHPPKEK